MSTNSNLQPMSLSRNLVGRVALVTGASRGIGRECALALARKGCHVVVAAKSTRMATAPEGGGRATDGTIESVAGEIQALCHHGDATRAALPVRLDMRSEDDIHDVVAATMCAFGQLDILVHNASALYWQDIIDTPLKRFDLMHAINARGTFALTRACLPIMQSQGFGRIITMSPPIEAESRYYNAKTAYAMSKYSMTMVALGAAEEGRGYGISANALWPATVVESKAASRFELGDPAHRRKASILADCVTHLCEEPDDFTGHALIDDEYLTSRHGYTAEDLKKYRVDPDVEPRRLLAREVVAWKRGGGAS
ncbi:MAG: SDR family oxidoreductase [Rhodobacteraceae bacterium]|nr:SDR family oxidoreductase [Paracoccaceae bacterium]